ncbi:hypothetical protein C3L33_03835, partial [Rhododendron williamsianum]
TEKFYTEVQEIILARYNKTFDWSLKAKMMGKKAIESARIFIEETGIDSLTPEEFLVEREDMGKPFDKTPTCKWNTNLRGNRVGFIHVISCFSCIVSFSKVKQGKPSPDIFLAAAKRFEGGPIVPQNTLVFEDAPLGVCAAKSAGMSAVMVPDPRLDSSYLEHDGEGLPLMWQMELYLGLDYLAMVQLIHNLIGNWDDRLELGKS